MCGIIGYIGERKASAILIESLKDLEYRGYDSWGIALKGRENNSIECEKKAGNIADAKGIEIEGSIGIGHTRWATHGKVEEKNAHPIFSNSGETAVVHNGIIENYQELRKQLQEKGIELKTDTDTEVIPNLIEIYLKEGKENQNLLEAIQKTIERLEGRYSFLVLHEGFDGFIAVMKGSPLHIGIDKERMEDRKEVFISSDINAFLKYTNKIVEPKNKKLNPIAVIERNENKIGVNFYREKNEKNLKGLQDEETITKDIDVEHSGTDKAGYQHYMMKEIMEQRNSIKDALNQNNESIQEIADNINNSFGSFLVGCGTAGKVALLGTYLFSEIARKHINFAFGSEFPNQHHFLTEKTLMLAISQSGETADTLEAIEVAREKKGRVVSLVNAVNSTMERKSDYTIPVKAGVEKAVASTKATTGQIAILTLLAYACSGKLEEGKKELMGELGKLDELFEKERMEKIKAIAESIKKRESMYVIGRGYNYPIALESAIKLQEVSYIHAEGFAGGELKHGPLALIGEDTPCIVFVSDDESKKEIISNAIEIKSRGGFIIGISPENNEVFDYWIKVPAAGIAGPIANLIPVQMLAYYLSVLKGIDPDHPRNLAKCVTVK